LLLEKKAREQKAATESVSRERFSFSTLLNHSLKSRKNKYDKGWFPWSFFLFPTFYYDLFILPTNLLFSSDGFLLDVTYITPQIIRMRQVFFLFASSIQQSRDHNATGFFFFFPFPFSSSLTATQARR